MDKTGFSMTENHGREYAIDDQPMEYLEPYPQMEFWRTTQTAIELDWNWRFGNAPRTTAE